MKTLHGSPAIVAWRLAEPADCRTRKGAWRGISEAHCDLRSTQLGLRQQPLGKLAAHLVTQIIEAGSRLGQAPLQRALGNMKVISGFGEADRAL